jgi:hypothetical protein
MRIQSAFEQAGILFLDDDAGGAAGEEAPAKLVLTLHRKPIRARIFNFFSQNDLTHVQRPTSAAFTISLVRPKSVS